jgi:D-sedoheptulose 7-phosphate isomerase
MKETTKKFITNLVERYPVLDSCSDAITDSINTLIECYKNGNKLLTCGNGGSASDAIHIVGELMKAFILPRKLSEDEQEKIRRVSAHADYLCDNLQGALPAISLVSETALLTAYSNDVAPDLAFAQQVFGYGQTGDVLLAISTSGNSTNVIYAVEVARAKGIKVISLTGNTGGKLRNISDILINVPEDETFIIQELHLPIYHTICLALENEFFGD